MALSITTYPEGIINARSPIFYKFSGASLSYNYTLFIYIDGLEYLTIDRSADSNSTIIIDISDIIRNYLRSTQQYNLENSLIFKVILKEYDGETINASVAAADIMAVYGYTEYNDGINYSRGDLYQANSDPDNIYLPNYGVDNDYSSTWVTNYDINGSWSITTGSTIIYTEVFDTDIQKINIGYNNLKSLCDININDPFCLNVFSGVTLLKTTNVYPISCNGNELNNITFVNKYGVWDKIFITGKVVKNLSTDYDQYKYNNLNYSNMQYLNKGTYHKFLNSGKENLTINTGWVPEYLNDKLEELFISEIVYYNHQPVLITSKELQFKTHRFDKLINYTINAEYAYDKINNVK